MPQPAYQHNNQPCTRAQFYAIACDPRRHVAVEACAGAGKTWMLVSRILRALLAGCAPQEILAITFTRKAAGEMRQRLHEWLADFARARPGETRQDWAARLQKELADRGIEPQAAADLHERLRNLYPTLLAQGRAVQIRTFHSWFTALLRSAPLQVLADLGLPAGYELLEDNTDAVAEAWRRYLDAVERDPELCADYAGLVIELGRTNAHKALEGALARRIEFQLADEAGHVDQAVARFDAVYPHLAGVGHPSDWLLRRTAGRELLQGAARALAALKAPTFAAKGDELAQAMQAEDWNGVVDALFTKQGTPRIFGTKRPDVVTAAQREVEVIIAACRQHDAHVYHQRLARLTRAFNAEFGRLKYERGWVDLADVERAALTLLSDDFLSGYLQQRLDARVRHLLIDEFQDTNPLQWQALHAWLQGYAGAGGGGLAPPSVFIVGDPKQSIYRFRGADPRVFSAAQQFIADGLGGDLLACDHTRRNAPGLLEAVNAVMGQAHREGQFAGWREHTTESGDAQGEVTALPLIARLERAASADPFDWRDSLNTPRVELQEHQRTLEARQAARWIAAQIAAGTPARAIMALCRKRQPLGELQAELRALAIACEQPEAQRLGDQPVVQDLLALADALVSPGHDLSLARALKSPLFGLSDDELTCIALAVNAATDAQGQRPAWLDVLPDVELPGRDARALHTDLMQCQRWLATLPPHDALQAIYRHGDVLARFAAAAPAPEREHTLAQLRALLGSALQAGGGRFLTAYQWIRALRRQNLPAPLRAAPDGVQLLTVHGAKGLEADCVLLLGSAADAERAALSGPGALIDWPSDEPRPRRIAFVANDRDPPPSLSELAAQEDAARAREELNALYVAMTRARRRLVISGIEPHREPASSWWQRIKPVATPLPEPDAPDTVATPTAEFALKELPPALATDEPQQAPGDPDHGPSTDASRLGEAMHWLLEHAADTPQGWRAERIAQAMQRFALTAIQAARADTLARRIHTGEAAWAWDACEIIEAFDEVELTHDGQRLRIDRLVCRRAYADAPETWWVLDYKSAAQPERDPLLQAQLARYRAAIERLHPGQAVRAAFLSGEGRVVE
ncbi:MAG: UvrD-helicase domain-containing protein [Burkholderiaceae bacterium]|jgi:ATP-dependent helicase/nuclease subunit A|nr:UvrD-helicase domain-containing protein [Burkholderiaceae bacterium]